MGLILWIILGLIAGWLASTLTGRDRSMGADILLGVVGAILGGLLMSVLGFAGVTGFNIYSLFVATIGAIALISLRRMLA